MTTPSDERMPAAGAALASAALRRLFLTLFLRGRSSRGLSRRKTPSSVGAKLGLTLVIYALVGVSALALRHGSVFALSAYLHSVTFVFLGMFVAASSGEILFNQEEADILLHRPVLPRALLWAKIRVLAEVSLWLAGVLNLCAFFVGATMPAGGWLFPIAHALSLAMEALFCVGCVVLVYQLCLRWFGRERLEGLMTMSQVVLALSAVLAGQVIPQVMRHAGNGLVLNERSWWLGLLPPVWFGAFDAAFTGHGTRGSWVLAGIGVVATGAVLRSAFGKLATDYQRGLQTLQEGRATAPASRVRRRWIDVMVTLPPLRFWLRDSVSRAAFLLTVAYLLRDRDVKLRVYPGVAPMFIMPFLFMLRAHPSGGPDFAVAMGGSFLGLTPLLALGMLRFSQHWQASDVFRAAPMLGPAQLCHGARRAVLFLLTFPLLALFALIALISNAHDSDLLLTLPGLLTLPIYALVPCIGGKAVPLSLPSEDAKAAGRGVTILVSMLAAMAVSGLGMWARSAGWFWWFLAVEAAVVAALYIVLRVALAAVRWRPLE
jgi:hypothetical protein